MRNNTLYALPTYTVGISNKNGVLVRYVENLTLQQAHEELEDLSLTPEEEKLTEDPDAPTDAPLAALPAFLEGEAIQ